MDTLGFRRQKSYDPLLGILPGPWVGFQPAVEPGVRPTNGISFATTGSFAIMGGG
jgi:hypothetical protein